MKKTLIAVLAGLVLLTGCGTTIRYIEVKPECEAPPLPVLPELQWGELQGSEETLQRLEEYEALLVDSLIEHRRMLRELCGPTDNPE